MEEGTTRGKGKIFDLGGISDQIPLIRSSTYMSYEARWEKVVGNDGGDSLHGRQNGLHLSVTWFSLAFCITTLRDWLKKLVPL